MEDILMKPKMHVFICINDRRERSDKPSCGPHISRDDVKQVKYWLLKQGLVRDVFCTKCQCLGFCNSEGAVLAVWPQGRFVKGIKNIEEVKKIIKEEFEKLSSSF